MQVTTEVGRWMVVALPGKRGPAVGRVTDGQIVLRGGILRENNGTVRYVTVLLRLMSSNCSTSTDFWCGSACHCAALSALERYLRSVSLYQGGYLSMARSFLFTSHRVHFPLHIYHSSTPHSKFVFTLNAALETYIRKTKMRG